MRASFRFPVRIGVLVSGLLALAACSGGGGGGTPGLQLHCIGGEAFCLVACDLGCAANTCSVTEVAENQRLQFIFNRDIDRTSVNGSSFSIRTLTGQAPDGDFVIAGNSITFVPAVRVTNGLSSFGFQRNETYVLTLAGGPTASQSIRSVSGDSLQHEFTCTLTATLGIIDDDNAPPRGTMILPIETQNAPLNSTIEIRFSELIDASPFLVPVNPGTPIRYLVRRSHVDPITNERICDRNSAPFVLGGIPRVRVEQFNGRDVTVVSLTPNVTLPGLSCVEVQVTADVRDLSGRNAEPSTHVFFTMPSNIGDLPFEEDFQNTTHLDPLISSGTWGPSATPGARPGLIGGDGRHGSFDPTLGTSFGPSSYEWNTDNFTIPVGLNGQSYTITDGKFFFTDFIVPEGTTIRFVGTNPAQIFVRGKIEVRGQIEGNAVAMANFNQADPSGNFRATTNVLIPGQPGGTGGPGGGRGGKGGDRCLGAGPTVVAGVVRENGVPGEDVRLLAGHAYLGQRALTGGQGSGLFPVTGLNSSVNYTVNFAFAGNIQSGGGGGGFNTAGVAGSVTPPLPGITIVPGPPSTPGVQFDPLPFPPPAAPPGYSSLNHFLIGGSGGGGGGSHPFLALTGQAGDTWRAGAGGSGGGGAMALRAGGALTITGTARLLARGGPGALFSDRSTRGIPCPGGGGSGGSFVLQSGGDLTMAGLIDTSGGNGSRTGNIDPITMNVETKGGAGSAGFYRIEAGGTAQITAATSVPAFNAARNQGPLTDRDDLVGCASLFRGTGLIFPPTWLRYEIDVDIDGDGTIDALYSDDPSVPNTVGPANDPIGPLRAQFQGAQVNTSNNQPIAGTLGPWRDFVNENAGQSINVDAATGFRFQLIFNRRDFPNVVVRRLLVVARG